MGMHACMECVAIISPEVDTRSYSIHTTLTEHAARCTRTSTPIAHWQELRQNAKATDQGLASSRRLFMSGVTLQSTPASRNVADVTRFGQHKSDQHSAAPTRTVPCRAENCAEAHRDAEIRPRGRTVRHCRQYTCVSEHRLHGV
jgi:hypothetical protein